MATTPDSPAPGPLRTCVGCRVKATTSELLRLVAGTDAHGRPAVVPDPASIAPGRGAHLHPTSECYALAERRRAFTRALRPRNQEGAAVALSSEPVKAYLDAAAPDGQPDQRNWSTRS